MAHKSLVSFLIIASITSSLSLPSAAQQARPGPHGGTGQLGMMDPSFMPELMQMNERSLAPRPPRQDDGSTQIASNIRPRPEPQKCLALAQKVGASNVWWGRHVGEREARQQGGIFEWGPRKESFDAIGCFNTRQDCENWLYWMRTDYPEFGFIRPCRRGL